MNHLSKRWFHSVRCKIIVLIFSIILPMWLLLAFHNSYATRVVKNQVIESYESTLNLYMNEVDDSLDAVERYFFSLAASDIRLQTMSLTSDKSLYTFQKQTLYSDLSYNRELLGAVDMVFTYSPPVDDFMRVDTSESISYADKLAIQAFLCDYYANTPDLYAFSSWNPATIGDARYLFRVISVGNIYIGACVGTERLLSILTAADSADNGVLILLDGERRPITAFQAHNGRDIVLTDEWNALSPEYIVIRRRSTAGGFSLIKLLAADSLLEKLPLFRYIIYLISLALAALLVFSLLYLRKIIVMPIMRMYNVTARIRQGELTCRIPGSKAADEFAFLNESFNSMLDTLQEYKIEIYEETCNRQKAELQYLHLQINPHFFLNALNMVFTLARSEKYEMIQSLTYSLIEYFRHLLRDSFSMVGISEEMSLIDHYIRIQTFRYPDTLILNANVPDEFLSVQVPLLTLYTFVENAVKYSMTQDEPLVIELRVWLESGKVCISISDNGTGFAPETLKILQRGEKVVDALGEEHIGIWNIGRRLKLLYAERASLRVDNRAPHGAQIVISLPDTRGECES